MPIDQEQVIQLAVQKRLISRKQADTVRQELAVSGPSVSAGMIMLNRSYITEDQVRELESQTAGGGGGGRRPAPVQTPDDENFGGIVTKKRSEGGDPGGGGSARPPTMEELRARRAGGGAPPQQQQAAPQQAAAPQPQAQAQPAVQGVTANPKTLVGFLKLARHWGCSDLHLCVGRSPFVRLNGQIRYMEMDPLTPERAMELNFEGLDEQQRATAVDDNQIDFALEIPGVGRHRCNVFHQRLGWDGAYRVVRAKTPTITELGLPDTLRVYTEYNQGLVMVTGPGGAGKTTTVAALLDLVNTSRKDHIITVEDPVEYIVAPKSCQITQREVGRHTESFANALRAALREDPDIIMIGEMRDLETTSIAISAAETGHLVFGTLHTASAIRTVSRIVDVYPLSQQKQIRTMVAESLRGVISQRLVPRKDGNGRATALEILMNTSGVATQLKEGKTHMITSLIQSGKRYGMCLMEDSLLQLYNQGVISGYTAYMNANNRQPFERMKEEM